MINNILYNIVFILLITVLQLLNIKLINVYYGIEVYGVLALLTSLIGVSRILDGGYNTSVIKFVSESLNNEQNDIIVSCIQIMLIFSGAIVLILYFLISIIMPRTMPDEIYTISEQLLFWCALSIFFTMLYYTNFAIMDGLHLTKRKIIPTLIGFLSFSLSITLLSKFELLGLGISLTVQSFTTLFVSIYVLRHKFNIFNIFYKANLQNIKIILKFTAKFQIGNIAMLLFDPVSRFFLAKTSGAEVVGVFELVNQILSKIKQLLSSAHNIALSYLKSNKSIMHTVQSNYIGINYAVVTLFFTSSLLISADIVEFMTLSQQDWSFMIILLHVAWMVNSYTNPIYFKNISDSNLFANNIAHITIGLVNTIFCVFGAFLGNNTVILANATSVISGSLLLILMSNAKIGKMQYGFVTFTICIQLIINRAKNFTLFTDFLIICGMCFISSAILWNYQRTRVRGNNET